MNNYCLCAVFEIDPDHARWKTSKPEKPELYEYYTSRKYKTQETALQALQGNWGDIVASSASDDNQNYGHLHGYCLGDVVVVDWREVA